uniref:AsmA protein n=1 Tax=Candidatus Kentrum sp. FW TaxID=2126338 RepID=A0A450S4X3_9GAMM|nr:MAG: AsmA protein [Candidatus Kentron sp. FW]
MKALFKIIGIIIGIVIVFFVAAAVIVPIYFHPNDYKEEIAAVVQEKTGRDLKIHGDIVLSVFPWLAVELGSLELGNAPGFPDGEFVRLERMEVGVKLLPLLSRRLEVRAVKVHGLELNLAKDKNGRTNWSDLVALQSKGAQSEDKKRQEGKKEHDEQVDGGTTEPEVSLAILGIGGLDIRNAALRWSDAQNSQYYRLEKLTVETGAIASESLTSGSATIDEPVRLKASFNIEGNKPRINGHVETGAELTANFAKQVFQLANFSVTGKLAGESLPNSEVAFDFRSNIAIDLAKQTLQANDLVITTGQINGNGAVIVNRLLDRPVFDGTLQLQEFNPRTLFAELGIEVPPTTDPKALTSASVSTTIQGAANRIRLKPLTIRFDQTALNGMLEVANFAAPAIRFDLEMDTIDVDRYLPPAKSEQTQSVAEGVKPAASAPAPGTPAATPGAVASQATRFPLETLRALDVHGKARVGKLTVAKLNLSDLALDLEAKDGLIRAHPVKVNLYQGSYSGNIGIDARGQAIRIDLGEKLADVQVGPLLRDLLGSDLLTGKLRFALDAEAGGTTPDDLKKTLKGNADVKFEDGMINGIDIVHIVCDAAESLLGSSGASSDKGMSEGTRFQELTGQLPIQDGRVGINETLELKAPLLRLKGKGGAVDVGGNRLDNVAFIVKPSFTCEGQSGKAFDRLSGADIPIICKGPMEAPSCRPDSKAILKIVSNAIGKEKTNKLTEKAKQKIEKKATEILSDKLGDELGNKLGDEVGEAVGNKLKDLFR